MSIREKVQKILDEAVGGDYIFSHWNTKSKTADENSREYIVYRKGLDRPVFFADNKVILNSNAVTIIYFYDTALRNTAEGRKKIESREIEIKTALMDAKFTVDSFDGGNIEDNDFESIIFECEVASFENY